MWRMPVSQSELDAITYLAREFPKKFWLEEMRYLEGMCIHWRLWEKNRNGMEAITDEIVSVYFGKPAIKRFGGDL